MQKLTILNSKEIKLIKEQLLEHFGVFFEGDYAFLQNEKNKLFMINRDLGKIDLAKLRIDKLGLYVAERNEGVLRLSREGAQRLVLEARKKKLPGCMALPRSIRLREFPPKRRTKLLLTRQCLGRRWLRSAEKIRR